MKYELLRKKKELKLAKKMVKDAEKKAKREEKKKSEKNKNKNAAVALDDGVVEEAFEDMRKRDGTAAAGDGGGGGGDDESLGRGKADSKSEEEGKGRGGTITTTKAMKRPGQMKKTTDAEKKDGDVREENEGKVATSRGNEEEAAAATRSARGGENEEDVKRTKESTTEEVQNEDGGKATTTTTTTKENTTGAMKITFKKKAANTDASKGDASASAASQKKNNKEEPKKEEEEEEEDPMAKAIAKAKLVMQKENERREKEEKEAELKKKMEEEEEARRKEEDEQANAVPKVIVPKFGKKRELDPEWLKQENERYEREQKEREERERIEKEEALKPKKRQKRPKLAPKKLLPPVPKNVPGVGNLDTDEVGAAEAAGEGATANGDVEAGEMAVLDDETAKAVGVGQKIHEEEEDHDDGDRSGGTEVFVGGIPPEANERDVGDAFSRFGKVSKVRLFDMQSYGFVKFYGVKAADAAVKHYEGCDGTGNNPIEDPVLICDVPVSIVEFAASGKDLVVQKAKEIAMKKREGESLEEEEAARAKAREVMTYEEI